MDNIILTQKTKQTLVKEILAGVENLLDQREEKNLLAGEYLTSKEVQKLLKISSVTLWNYDQNRTTRPQKIGNRKRYLKADILSLLNRKKQR